MREPTRGPSAVDPNFPISRFQWPTTLKRDFAIVDKLAKEIDHGGVQVTNSIGSPTQFEALAVTTHLFSSREAI